MESNVWTSLLTGTVPLPLLYAVAAIVVLHGLIHVMGFVAYWPVAAIAGLPFKTTLLDGRWSVGAGGMRRFAGLWLLAAAGYGLALAGLLVGQTWWPPALVLITLLSLAITALDWRNARAGALVDVVILTLVIATVLTK